jgi:hypothetical protein
MTPVELRRIDSARNMLSAVAAMGPDRRARRPTRRKFAGLLWHDCCRVVARLKHTPTRIPPRSVAVCSKATTGRRMFAEGGDGRSVLRPPLARLDPLAYE